MDQDELTHLLEAVAAGALSTADAALRIRTQPYVDAGGFAKVDLHRRVRCGFPEVIFGQGKTAEQIEAILRTLITHGQGGLVTRVEPAAEAHLRSAFPEGRHNPVGRTFRIESPEAAGAKVGRVVVVTAGTSDLPVAEEARKPWGRKPWRQTDDRAWDHRRRRTCLAVRGRDRLEGRTACGSRRP